MSGRRAALKLGLKRIFQRKLPQREDFAASRWLAPVAHRILSPELWRYTRRSVPRGVALGLFAGLVIPFGQILLAGFLALPVRANVSIAALATFVSNPLTLPFWIVLATRVGRFFLHAGPGSVVEAVGGGGTDSYWQSLVWFARSAGEAAVGFLVLAIVGAALGYVVTGFGWRWWIGRKHRARRLRVAPPVAPDTLPVPMVPCP